MCGRGWCQQILWPAAGDAPDGAAGRGRDLTRRPVALWSGFPCAVPARVARDADRPTTLCRSGSERGPGDRIPARHDGLLDQASPARPEAPQELEPRALQLAPTAKRPGMFHMTISRTMRAGASWQRPGLGLEGTRAGPADGRRADTGGGPGCEHDPGRDHRARRSSCCMHSKRRSGWWARLTSRTRPARTTAARVVPRLGPHLLHSGAALRLGPNPIRTKTAFDAAIRELERAGWAVAVAGGAEVDGKPRRRAWTIHL